jgi:hypothetical protein
MFTPTGLRPPDHAEYLGHGIYYDEDTDQMFMIAADALAELGIKDTPANRRAMGDVMEHVLRDGGHVPVGGQGDLPPIEELGALLRKAQEEG